MARMSKKLKQFIKSNGFSDVDIAQMSRETIANFRHEMSYLRRIGMID